MTRPENDPDRKTVYHAESLAFGDTVFDEPVHSSEFLYLAGQLFAHDWWVSNKIPIPFFEPTNGSDSSHATVRSTRIGGESIIRMAACDINPRVLAHEAAHIAQSHFYNPDFVDIPGHGREFRACYLNVAEILLGRDAASNLKANFDAKLVDPFEGKRGQPGWILTVPDVDRALDNEGLGLFPRWRAREQATEFEGLRQRIKASLGQPRINGAISL